MNYSEYGFPYSSDIIIIISLLVLLL